MNDQSAARPIRLAVLISGGGTTLRNLLDRIQRGSLPAEPVLVISSRANAAGLAFATAADVPTKVIRRSSSDDAEAFSETIFTACREARVELVAMAGFLSHVLIPADFAGRVMNIHPSLIPAFCGKGYYGQRVHQAVLNYGAKVSGCTVHFVDNEYDHGPIILQRVVNVADGDTAESLAARVFAQECEAYPQAIQWFAEGKLKLVGRHVLLQAPL